MRSVRIAPETLACSRCAGSPSSATSSAQYFKDLLGTLEAQESATDHQQRRDRDGQESAEQQRGRQQDQQLVTQGAKRDAPDHRQLALGREAGHISRRDGGVVDHHARGLHARLAGSGRHIVKRGGGESRDRGDIIEQGGEAGSHEMRGPSGGCEARPVHAGNLRRRKDADPAAASD
jgi:Ni/Co efflux regulator RcnB